MYSNSDSGIDLVGRSAVFIEVMKHVGRVAVTSLPVLLTGESGTGKEVVAIAMHRRSLRGKQPFIAVNCGAIPSGMIESELFGHVKGAFTGANRDHTGVWEEADGGTVFLDEISETSLTFQLKLLHAIEDGETRKVGTNHSQRFDVRLIVASNRDLEAEVKAGRFQQDLFRRLNTVAIALPPLRERKEDILVLAERFAQQGELKRPVKLSEEAIRLLEHYPWPGNVRELENAVIQGSAMCDGTIRVADLPERVRSYQSQMNSGENQSERQLSEVARPAWLTLAEVEGQYVSRVLRFTRGNKQAAARVLRVDRKTLDRMIKRHNISVNRSTRVPVSPR